jgi:hypothetical protein
MKKQLANNLKCMNKEKIPPGQHCSRNSFDRMCSETAVIVKCRPVIQIDPGNSLLMYRD